MHLWCRDKYTSGSLLFLLFIRGRYRLWFCVCTFFFFYKVDWVEEEWVSVPRWAAVPEELYCRSDLLSGVAYGHKLTYSLVFGKLVFLLLELRFRSGQTSSFVISLFILEETHTANGFCLRAVNLLISVGLFLDATCWGSHVAWGNGFGAAASSECAWIRKLAN